MAWRRERRRNRFSHVLPSSSIAACAGDAGEAVSSPSAAAVACAPARRSGRGRLAASSVLPDLAPAACCCAGAHVKRWFRSPSAAAAAFAPARRPGRKRLAAPSALPGPAPAPSAAARFPRSRPLPGDRPPFAPAHRALSPTSCRLIPEPCPPSADPDGASRRCWFFLFFLRFLWLKVS